LTGAFPDTVSFPQPAGQRNRPAQPAGWLVFCPHDWNQPAATG
jgi:hypothetical protein